MTARKFNQYADTKSAQAQKRVLSNTVVVTGTAAGSTVVRRDQTTGRFATVRSTHAIDATALRFSEALERLAKK